MSSDNGDARRSTGPAGKDLSILAYAKLMAGTSRVPAAQRMFEKVAETEAERLKLNGGGSMRSKKKAHKYR